MVGRSARRRRLRAVKAKLAKSQLRRVGEIFALDPNLIRVLSQCKKAVEVSIPVARDDGAIEVYLGYRVTQENIPRELLYVADELFFVGTAVEITPVRSVDKITVGNGRRGPVTEAIQRRFLDTIMGKAPDTHGWLTYVPQAVAAGLTNR